MNFLSRLLGTGADPRDAYRPLWHRVIELAREPSYYARCGVADTLEGRFDMLTSVLALAMLRMERSEAMRGSSHLLAELFVDDMEGQLREAGIGDPTVGKKMGKYMAALGGRIGAYRKAFDGEGDDAADLVGAVERNTSFADGGGSAECVAKGLADLWAGLGRTSDAQLRAGTLAE